MKISLQQHFSSITLQRGNDYVSRNLVISAEEDPNGQIIGQVTNGRDKIYNQRIIAHGDLLHGTCSCPVGHNCKHVAAVIIKLTSQQRTGAGGLTIPVQGWLSRLKQATTSIEPTEQRGVDYPENIKDRLLYVLTPNYSEFKVDIFVGRLNTASNTLNKSMRRYDTLNVLRRQSLPQFIRPIDLDLISTLSQGRMMEQGYGHGYSRPDLLRPRGDQAIAIVRRLCDTGRFLHDKAPNAQLAWSHDKLEAQLDWRLNSEGHQKLSFQDLTGKALTLCGLEQATFWVDVSSGTIGALAQPIALEVLRLVDAAPSISPEQVEALGAALPDQLGELPLPRPHKIQHIKRPAHTRTVKLTLGAEKAHEGSYRWGGSVELPTLTLRFVYDGKEVSDLELDDPTLVSGDQIITLTRDHVWESSCFARLLEAGALPIDDLELHWPSERMNACDLAFADDEISTHSLEISRMSDALDFAFRVIPQLRKEGWEIITTPKWPYHLSEKTIALTVATHSQPGENFHGNEWFSLGFQTEIDGKAVDVAPLIAAFLEQIREDWVEVPSLEALTEYLAHNPVYLNDDRQDYVALDLTPLGPLLHLFLSYQIELGAFHPTDANLARLAEEALQGSNVQFSDNAGVLTLAQNLAALSQPNNVSAPRGLQGALRDYQLYGAAWMAGLLSAGFGGVLADDMGLGKTVQALALLQARREAGVGGPTLLIVPTSLIYSWQSQAAKFTPELKVVTLHGADRAALHDSALRADLIITTYPLLARDREWLAAHNWTLIVLDEAQILKNPASQMAKALRTIPTDGRLALTGTPLENSLQDLWTLIDWTNPGLLGDRTEFQRLFRTPIEKYGDKGAQARLNRRLRPFLLRRTKQEVAAELPAKTEIIERVDLPKPQQALYEAVRSAMDTRVRKAISTKGLAGSRITVLDALLKLRQVCCDPKLVKSGAARSLTESAKRRRLRELVTELVAEGRRVLIFSQFVEMLGLIEADLYELGVSYLILTGQTKNRAEILSKFANGDADVFLLSLKAGGIGLTLTEADTVILYDPWWNPAVERQAMDRSHRIGQDKPVFVYRLVASGTVEEKILEMQARKQSLADALFDDTHQDGVALLDETILQELFAPLESDSKLSRWISGSCDAACEELD